MQSQVEALLEEAMLEANEHARTLEENHKIRRMQADKRRKSVYLNRSARVLQRWFRRTTYARKVFTASIMSNLASVAVESILNAALTQRVQLLVTITEVLLSSSEMIDFNYRYIMVIQDLLQFRVYIFILYRSRMVYFVAYLTKSSDSMTRGLLLLVNGCSSLSIVNSIDPRLILQYAMNDLSADLDRVSFPLLLTAHSMDDSNDLRNPADAMTRYHELIKDETAEADSIQQDKIVQSCSNICQVIQKAISRQGFRAIHQWKASVQIQSMWRGFLIRSRLDSIRGKTFDYIDTELETIFCDDILYELSEDDVSDSNWQPSRPAIEWHVNVPLSDGRVKLEPTNNQEEKKDITSPSVYRRDQNFEPQTVPHRKPSKRITIREDTTPTNLLPTQRSTQPRESKMKEWRLKNLRIARHMKQRGSNGRALSSRR